MVHRAGPVALLPWPALSLPSALWHRLPHRYPGNGKQTWRVGGGLVRTGLVGRLGSRRPAQPHACQLPRTFREGEAGRGPRRAEGPQLPAADVCWGDAEGRLKGEFYLCKFKGQSPRGHVGEPITRPLSAHRQAHGPGRPPEVLAPLPASAPVAVAVGRRSREGQVSRTVPPQSKVTGCTSLGSAVPLRSRAGPWLICQGPKCRSSHFRRPLSALPARLGRPSRRARGPVSSLRVITQGRGSAPPPSSMFPTRPGAPQGQTLPFLHRCSRPGEAQPPCGRGKGPVGPPR